LRHVPAILACASALFLAGAWLVAKRDSVSGPPINRATLTVSFGEAKVGETVLISVPITAEGDEGMTIVGAEGASCGPWGCKEVRDGGLPLRIGLGGRGSVDVQVESHLAGPFDQLVTLYTDHPQRYRLVVRVTGRFRERGATKRPGALIDSSG
jgi:hypothetical protein